MDKIFFPFFLCVLILSPLAAAAPIIINHTCTDTSKIPDYWLEKAKQLTMEYAHRSDGNQILEGLAFLNGQNSTKYGFAEKDVGSSGTASLPAQTNPPRIRVMDGNPPQDDYSYPELYWNSASGRTATINNAATGLFNYSMWSWCNELADSHWSTASVQTYLDQMDAFEQAFPHMRFIYQTGFTDEADSVSKTDNQYIRDYAISHNKVLFDFDDIGRYDPAGNYYSNADRACTWCSSWCSAHPSDCASLPSTCSHSDGQGRFICIQRGKAFWWMMARLAGWDGQTNSTTTTSSTTTTTTTLATTTTTSTTSATTSSTRATTTTTSTTSATTSSSTTRTTTSTTATTTTTSSTRATTTSTTTPGSTTTTTTTSTSPTTSTTLDLVLHLKLDDGSGVTAYDSSVYGLNGALVGGPVWVAGAFGNALHFDGVDDYVEVVNSAVLSIPDSITIAAWVKPEAGMELCYDGSAGNYGVLSSVSDYTDSASWDWQLRYGAPTGCYLGFQFHTVPEGSVWVTVGQDLTPGQWYHVAATYDGTTVRSYLNGQLKETGTMSAIAVDSQDRVFLGDDGWADYFNGALDDVRIYHRALSSAEISQLYTATTTSTSTTTTTTLTSTTTTTTTSSSSSSSSTSPSTTTTLRVPGDANGDGHVDYNDLIILASSYYKQTGESGYDSRADYNGDGQIGYDDLIILAANYGT